MDTFRLVSIGITLFIAGLNCAFWIVTKFNDLKHIENKLDTLVSKVDTIDSKIDRNSERISKIEGKLEK